MYGENMNGNEQNMYGQNMYGQNGGYTGIPNIRNYDPTKDYTPIGMWGYFGYEILFAIPVIGWLCLIIFALGGTKFMVLFGYHSDCCNFIDYSYNRILYVILEERDVMNKRLSENGQPPIILYVSTEYL